MIPRSSSSLRFEFRSLGGPILATALTAIVSGVPACHDGSRVTGPDGSGYDPDIPTEWAEAVTNAWFPLEPGTTWEYEGETEDGTETTTVEVLSEIREVNGVEATVVHDRVYLDGELVEDTYDWYAQDLAGNVWYVGEESEELEGGEVVSTEGSWEWGIDGALPGIIMWADPEDHLDEEYRQEFYEGEAEDWGKVVGLDESVEVPFGSFDGCLRTEDWSGVEGRSASLEEKYYCPSVGTVLEVPVADPDERVELIDMTAP